jgi:hypothetical protein
MKCEKIENHIQIILKFLQILDQNLVKCFFLVMPKIQRSQDAKLKNV